MYDWGMDKEQDKHTILVIEDETPLQKAIKLKLELSGFRVLVTDMVDEGLKYLDDQSVRIDAIWLDHYLFGQKNGLDFLAEVKQKRKTQKIPVFVVTNTGGHEKRENYMLFGAQQYYVKAHHGLSEIVEDIIGRIQKGEE